MTADDEFEAVEQESSPDGPEVADRPKPLAFHPANGGDFYDALVEAIGAEERSSRESLFGG